MSHHHLYLKSERECNILWEVINVNNRSMYTSAESYWLSFFIRLDFLELRPFILRVESTFSQTI